MQVGKLRKQMLIQQRSTTVDASGGQSATWADVFTAWCSIEALHARELFAAQAVRSEISHKITVRYRAEFADPVAASTLRGVYNGRFFNLQGVTNLDERNRTIEISASEGLSNG